MLTTTGRKVAALDRPLMRLIDFANLPMPISERRSALSTLNEARRALAAVAADPTLLERAPYPLGDLCMPVALKVIWIRARDQFPHPTVPGAVLVPVESGTGFNPATVRMDVEHLAATIWTVRSTLWRVALAYAHRDARSFDVGVPSAGISAARDRISVGTDGRITIEHRDISAALLAMLAQLDLGRVRICRAQYRRTHSRCCRLFLALRRDQQECSRQCADLRRHNQVRHPNAVQVRDSEVFKIQLARFKRKGD